MFVWAEIPGPYADMGSLDFSIHLLEQSGVAVSPGVGFGPSGEGFVRFALVDDEQRIETATSRISGTLDRL
jgi:alanine-synthesizing transaminase